MSQKYKELWAQIDLSLFLYLSDIWTEAPGLVFSLLDQINHDKSLAVASLIFSLLLQPIRNSSYVWAPFK